MYVYYPSRFNLMLLFFINAYFNQAATGETRLCVIVAVK